MKFQLHIPQTDLLGLGLINHKQFLLITRVKCLTMIHNLNMN